MNRGGGEPPLRRLVNTNRLPCTLQSTYVLQCDKFGTNVRHTEPICMCQAVNPFKIRRIWWDVYVIYYKVIIVRVNRKTLKAEVAHIYVVVPSNCDEPRNIPCLNIFFLKDSCQKLTRVNVDDVQRRLCGLNSRWNRFSDNIIDITLKCQTGNSNLRK